MKEKVSSTIILLCSVVIAIFATSCSKTTTNPNAAFIGTYYGTATYGSSNPGDTLVITSGNTTSSVNILSKGAAPGLSYTVSNATVSGTSLTVPSQAITIFGATDSVNGSGALIGSNLTINYTVHTATPFTMTYSGVKQ